ncbi:phosphopantetheine-binding protein (plasmid) [Phyllobacteriaceae bacterium JZ32]
MDMTGTIERIRGELSRFTDEDIRKVSADTNLIEIGLHSLAIMHLVAPLSRLAGAPLDYADLARQPSLGAWGALVCRLQDRQKAERG